MHSSLEQMTVWGLISDASLLVQAVMLSLVLASLASWYLIVQRSAVLRRSEREANAFVQRLRGSADLAQLQRDCSATADEDAGVQRLFQAGYGEFQLLRREPGIASEVVVEGVERSLLVAISEQEERLEKGLPLLATVGSVSPYIGLFGTVWGIMNSFIGLSQVQQATLSTVAPGIAEALIATAIGLFAAIPAVIAYNRFSARVASLSVRYYGFGNELQGRLHRHLHTGGGTLAAAA
ncbi:biopolymer transport protein TolQ [Pseudomonas cuatrocienegasensis]|uniref:Tol-Pal system protein TolQ n=1 Tax=Pseudomonas cuatrocienegasensis TaxID=543360 RepID=A0ABY1BIY1_9PSED|nr:MULTISPECIES: protein TolQ [Pseudomonas]OEC34592.1 protein TolQ [Pseudomonas sp. 21C1]SEQ97197.1 biopolymer transport protein TolQ [Pseudomonas cuatrocienegasensis]